MDDWTHDIPLLTLLLGLSIVLSVLTKLGLERLRLPAAIGWLSIGIALRAADVQWHWLEDGPREVFGFLSTLGVACLLFRVGLQCHLKSLIAQLGRAVWIWLGDFTVSGLIGFGTAYFALGLPLPTSLIIGTALTATSVGVSVSAWQQRGRLQSPTGQLMLDVAELDDISGVIAMSVLFAVLPLLHMDSGDAIGPLLMRTAGWFLIKLTLFATLCYLFSQFVEERLTGLFQRMADSAEPLLLIVAANLLIGSLAELLGLSIAIGAFLAGVMFSRDPEHVRIELSFDTLYWFFTPFFFIGIGLGVDTTQVVPSLMAGSVLCLAGMIGKVLGNGGPAFAFSGGTTAVLLGFSMMPRAEIAMIIVQRGVQLGDWAMPADVYGAMVLVSLVTCMASPLIVHTLLGVWPPPVDGARR